MDNDFGNYFCKLPSDLQILIINELVDPYVSILFLRVTKTLKQKLNRDLIIYRYLKKKSYDTYEEAHKEDKYCHLCNMPAYRDANLLKTHMEKHKRTPNKKFQMYKITPPCELCNVPKGYFHKCLLKTKRCHNSHFEYLGFVQQDCKYETYIDEPHSCILTCKECKEIITNGEEHFLTCSKKMNIVSKYGLFKGVLKENVVEYFCFYCEQTASSYDKEKNKCTCFCKICNKPNANRIINNEPQQYICRQCVKCAKCGEEWSTKGTWDYESLPYCEKCC